MRQARDVIEECNRDPDGMPIDFGDSIQVGAICGGRIGSPDRPFEFTYYPKGDARYGRWFLAFQEAEIKDIAEGVISELTLHCCTSSDCRSKFSVDSDSCFFCDYEDDAETVALRRQLTELAERVTSKEEWVVGYLKINPDAFGMSLIGDYNPIDGLGDRLGWFSPKEAQDLIDKVRARIQDGN